MKKLAVWFWLQITQVSCERVSAHKSHKYVKNVFVSYFTTLYTTCLYLSLGSAELNVTELSRIGMRISQYLSVRLLHLRRRRRRLVARFSYLSLRSMLFDVCVFGLMRLTC